MVDLGSGQGRSNFATAGVAALRRRLQKSENAGLGRKMLFMDGHYLILSIITLILTHLLTNNPFQYKRSYLTRFKDHLSL